MGAITDLWNSERGLVAIAIITASTVLAALGKMPIELWSSTTMYIFGIYAAAKTVTGAVGLVKGIAPAWVMKDKMKASSSTPTPSPAPAAVTIPPKGA